MRKRISRKEAFPAAAGPIQVTAPPHLHKFGETIPRAMLDVLIALIPALVIAVVVFGMNVIYIVTVSVVVACLSEALIRTLTRRKVTLYDLSAVVTGLLFAFLLPPTTPLWVVAIGAFIAVALAKELFGGLGKNVFNPALLARVILMITPLSIYTARYVKPFFWKQVGFFTPVTTRVLDGTAGTVAYQTLGGARLDAVNAATPLALLQAGKLARPPWELPGFPRAGGPASSRSSSGSGAGPSGRYPSWPCSWAAYT